MHTFFEHFLYPVYTIQPVVKLFDNKLYRVNGALQLPVGLGLLLGLLFVCFSVCRFATIDMSRKLGGGGCAPFVGELDPHLAQCGLGRGLSMCQVPS